MMRSRLLVAVIALSALTACGGDENEEGGDTKNDPPAQQEDHRANVTGSYTLTGTMRFVVNGESETGNVQDTLDIEKDTASASKASLNLDIGSMGCGPRASMSGERSFTVRATTCPMPPNNGCTWTLEFTQGTGLMNAGGSLQTSLQGTLTGRCSAGTAKADFFMDLSGPRNGQSLPDTRVDALTGARPSETGGTPAVLRAAMQQLASSVQQ
ncbi:hypothetical protein [Pyxidicoccus trucidator]|uniref:hypothetical protein n=1 Tax=Pyxidicoccus trucidator TaxID=2709662 RepID=UPI0013DA7EA6|nr:hypothetical protein [Pyxidicoccus trucidator]